MHTFKFHITQEMLWHAYNAMHDASREDRFKRESPVHGKQYALEVRMDLPDEIDPQNVRMQTIEVPLHDLATGRAKLTMPSVEFDVIPPEKIPPAIIAVREEPLKELSGVEYERMMYNMRVSEEE